MQFRRMKRAENFKQLNDLRICVVQTDIIWEDPSANLRKFSELIAKTDQADVIILPEMFTTGFTMHPENYKETMDGKSVSRIRNIASAKGAVITGTLIIEENGKIYNRCIWASPDGAIEYYDKRHLFTMSGEHMHYSAGEKRLLTEYKSWKFCPLICYDLRFPVWSRNREDYDVLLYMANWPATRHRAWKTLLPARAIENQAYCIGVNRVGRDGNGHEYIGDSVFVDPGGISFFTGDREKTEIFELSHRELHNFRKKFPVLKDRDEFHFKSI